MVFLVTSRIVQLVPNVINVISTNEMYNDKDRAIAAAKNILFTQVSKMLKDMKYKDEIEYKIEDIETYEPDLYGEIWGIDSDVHQNCDDGGPAQIFVYEYKPNSDGTFTQIPIYHLPGIPTEFPTSFYDCNSEEDE
jgi:hypothetical protein